MSSKREEICLQIRKMIIADRNRGLSCRKIAQKFNVSKSAVSKIAIKYKCTKTVENVRSRGRKRVTDAYEDRRIVRDVRKNPTLSARKIKEQLNLDISSRTVTRRLNEAGLHNHKAICKPHISEKNRRKRLRFAKNFVKKPLSFWKQVIWSDESKFELRNQKKKPRVWRKAKESYKKEFIVPTVKFGGGSVMVWGCFSWHGTGNLVPIDGIMNADKYIEILNENLEESSLKMSLQNNFTFQQDNDAKHTAKKTKKFLSDSGIVVLEWPAQSPDMNPIENLSSILDSAIPLEARTNKNDFLILLQEKFNQIDKKYLETLVESIPRRLEAIIKAKGGNTKY